MTDIQGALGVAQMLKARAIMAGRREGARRYDALLRDAEWLRLPFTHPDYVHGYQSYVCLFRPEAARLEACEAAFEQRNAVMAALEAGGIITRQGTHAPPHLHYYADKYGIRPADYPRAYLAERLTITLPLYAGMTPDEAEQVAVALREQFSATYRSRARC
jgi:dTDP-4-amino-4,6-dideoxygalactose transaminase